ncbi:MAG: SusC/RagA family TonB-linked outer membrane protein [Balneolaceae bacterium]|nr:SusC/RagA family TonB-linked outer membrane protein [Balneolaceae bacterium]
MRAGNRCLIGEPLPGVNVVVRGTTSGTSTDSEGSYELNVPSLQDTLVFSFIGYQTQEVPLNGRTSIDVALQTQAVTSEELIVVGYGTVSQENLTSSVKRVSSDEFVQGNVTDPAQLLKGKVAGLSVNKVGANPAETSQLKLRGTGTLVGNQSPLVIIDGVEGSLNDVSSQDIESINVIKDASAAAIYGTRGNNGVVVIETKRAEGEGVRLSYNGYVSTQSLTDEVDVLNAEEYRGLIDQGIDEAVDFGASTDWADNVMRETPISQEHTLTLSSGGEQTSYVANLNYKVFEGIVRRSDNNVLDMRLRVDHTMLDGDLDITGSAKISKTWRWDGYSNRVVKDIFAFNPTRPIYNEDGSYNDNADNNTENPVSLINETNSEFQETRANIFGTVVYSPIDNLTFKAQGSRFTTDGLDGFSRTKQHVIDLRDGTNGYASRSTSKNVQHVLDVTAEYQGTYGGHDFDVLGGYTWKQNEFENFFADNWDFPNDAVKYNNLSDGLALSEGQTTTDSYKEQSNLLGYFFRVNYDYNNKYLLMASFRREGSSKFGSNQKWGNFPAFSVGWNIANEPFMEEIDVINNLKVRFGYGRTGSEPTDPYLSLSRLSYGSNVFANGQWQSTIQPLNNSNPNLKWEEKEEFNLGLDFTILNQRLEGAVDLYRRETNDLLFNFTVPTPPFLFNSILANAGTIRNEGIEINLSGTPLQDSDLSWNSTVTYSTNRNELTNLSNDQFSIGGGFFDAGSTAAPIQQQTHRVQVGRAIGNFYGFKTIGVTDTGEWLIEGADGEPKSIADQTPEDKQVIGNGVPDHQISWTNTFNYQNWDPEYTDACCTWFPGRQSPPNVL